jgi:hypothetical protein
MTQIIHDTFSIKKIENEPMHFIPLADLFKCQSGITKILKRKYLTPQRRHQLESILNSVNEVILLHYVI